MTKYKPTLFFMIAVLLLAPAAGVSVTRTLSNNSIYNNNEDVITVTITGNGEGDDFAWYKVSETLPENMNLIYTGTANWFMVENTNTYVFQDFTDNGDTNFSLRYNITANTNATIGDNTISGSYNDSYKDDGIIDQTTFKVIDSTFYGKYDTDWNKHMSRNEVLSAISDYYSNNINRSDVMRLVIMYFDNTEIR